MVLILMGVGRYIRAVSRLITVCDLGLNTWLWNTTYCWASWQAWLKPILYKEPVVASWGMKCKSHSLSLFPYLKWSSGKDSRIYLTLFLCTFCRLQWTEKQVTPLISKLLIRGTKQVSSSPSHSIPYHSMAILVPNQRSDLGCWHWNLHRLSIRPEMESSLLFMSQTSSWISFFVTGVWISKATCWCFAQAPAQDVNGWMAVDYPHLSSARCRWELWG